MGIVNCCLHPVEEEEDDGEKEYLFAPKPNSYNGNRNQKNQRHGQGVYYYDNGDIYEGDWVNDGKQGHGTYHFVTGKVLKGYFENDSYVGSAPSKKNKGKKHATDKTEANPAKKIFMSDDGLIANEERPNYQSTSQRKLFDPNSRFDGISEEEVQRKMHEEKLRREKARLSREKHQKTVEKIRKRYNIPAPSS